MNRTSNNLESPSRRVKGLFAGLCVLLALPCQAAAGEDSYEYRLLNSPSPKVLAAEAKGRVTIYDGLKNESVEQALDQQFQRIERMMFIRTQYPQEDGGYQADDDC